MMTSRDTKQVMIHAGEIEMIEFLWKIEEESIKRLRQVSMLEWLYYIQL